ncbi:MAG: ankyrin repeat-containing domain protein [Linnemannia gamsii]|nr:MAG: ankyrin repeat-containing domain protein [Linnemannia gamsii]
MSRLSKKIRFRWACSKGHLDLVVQLLRNDQQQQQPPIDLGFRSDWFLREAAKNGRQSVVATLLAQRDYTPSENGLNKAFEAAYEQSSCETVKALLDYAEARGAAILEQQHRQQQQGPTSGATTTTPLFQSVIPSTRRARRVLAGGLSIQKDADKALRYAVRGNDIEMVRLLMDYEADVHAFNEEAVLVAAQKGHVEILKLLIQAGADIETKAGAPLRQASEGGHAEAVRTLCESGADTMWGGCSALRNAASQGIDGENIAQLLTRRMFCILSVFRSTELIANFDRMLFQLSN